VFISFIDFLSFLSSNHSGRLSGTSEAARGGVPKGDGVNLVGEQGMNKNGIEHQLSLEACTVLLLNGSELE
jgi:hypothetical protein